MKVYNEAKTREIQAPDLSAGKLVKDKLFVKRHDAAEAVNEVSHQEFVKEYPNGGKEYRTVVDTQKMEAKEAYDEYEDIYVYVQYSEKEKAERRIAELKSELSKTDYRAIKFAEGELTAKEYAESKKQRADWRTEINRLEETVNG